jgi:hypothetical protein
MFPKYGGTKARIAAFVSKTQRRESAMDEYAFNPTIS